MLKDCPGLALPRPPAASARRTALTLSDAELLTMAVRSALRGSTRLLRRRPDRV